MKWSVKRYEMEFELVCESVVKRNEMDCELSVN